MSQNIVELKNVTKAYKVGENYDMPVLIKPSSYIITAVSTFIVSFNYKFSSFKETEED